MEASITPPTSFASTSSRPVKQLVLTVAGLTFFCPFASSAPGQEAPADTRPPAHQPVGSAAAEPAGTIAPRPDVRFGKFEILATYTYAKALRSGLPEPEAKTRGIVAAVMASRARGMRRGGPRADADPKKPRKPTLTAATFDAQIAARMEPFFGSVFLPTIKKLVDARLTYDQVKVLLKIPPAVGAKMTAKEFAERTAEYRGVSRLIGPPR